jgi:CBS domain-containing membrane protein
MAWLGASALLVCVLPGSPMAQPWVVIATYTVFGLVGVSAALWISESLLAMPIAVSIAFRDVHLAMLASPAAAVVLIAVFDHITHYRSAFSL